MWKDLLKYDAITALTEHKDPSVSLTAQRDFIEKSISLAALWQLPEAQKILRRQRKNGSWKYPAAIEQIRTKENYNQLETYRNLGYLVEVYSFTKQHPAIQNAAEYLFSFQTTEGDFRGIYGNQYTPNYTAAIAEILIKAGYKQDARISKVFDWLAAIRQSDGGWAIPFRTKNCDLKIISAESKKINPDTSMPYSHMVTGVVLRAYAAHPVKRKSKEAKAAGQLLLSSLFKNDHYPDRAGKAYWLGFSFPFWFTDLISAMDTLSLLGFSNQEPEMQQALEWFIDHQKKNGLWDLKILKGRNKDVIQAWLALAICRIIKRLYE